MTKISKTEQRTRRHARTRAKVVGTATRPRLSVFKSNKHLYAQLIDDAQGKTLVSSFDGAIADADKKPMKEVAVLIGGDIAEKAKKNKITNVVFDKGGFTYGGNISALAQGAREGGLEF